MTLTRSVSEPKQDRSRVTRQRLLEATTRCLAEHGWSAATVSVIAKEAGISRGALQHHFPTREALVVAALEYMFEQRTALIEDGVPAESSAPAQSGPEHVLEVVRRITDLYTGELFRAALHVWTAAAADEQVLELVAPLERRFARAVHAHTVRELGVDDGDTHVRTLIQATLDMARGLALADLLSDDSKRRERIVRAWAQQLAAGLGVSPAADPG